MKLSVAIPDRLVDADAARRGRRVQSGMLNERAKLLREQAAKESALRDAVAVDPGTIESARVIACPCGVRSGELGRSLCLTEVTRRRVLDLRRVHALAHGCVSRHAAWTSFFCAAS